MLGCLTCVNLQQGIVRFASSMTGDELTPASQRPQGMYEGFTTAYGVVSEVSTCTQPSHGDVGTYCVVLLCSFYC